MDVFKTLQASLHYYEHVANKETPERAAMTVAQTQKLRKIIARIENELESESRRCSLIVTVPLIPFLAIQTQKDNLKDQLSRIFEGPELREHRVRRPAVYLCHEADSCAHVYSRSMTFGSCSCTTACMGAVTSTHMSTTMAHGGRQLTGMSQRQVILL
jgi:hypothetical protein